VVNSVSLFPWASEKPAEMLLSQAGLLVVTPAGWLVPAARLDTTMAVKTNTMRKLLFIFTPAN
jgi:hypothetical protein